MIGLGLLGGLFVYVFIAWVVTKGVRKNSSRRVAVFVGCIFFALPTTDALVGHAALEFLCKTEGKIVIHEVVPGVVGIGVEGSVNASSPDYYGVQFVEGDLTQSNPYQVTRITYSQNGLSYLKEYPVTAKSLYMLKVRYSENTDYFSRHRTIVAERKTGRELASFTWLTFRGGWAERMLFLGSSGPSCGSSRDQSSKVKDMLHQTFPDARPAPLN